MRVPAWVSRIVPRLRYSTGEPPRRRFLFLEFSTALKALRSRHTAADGGAVLCVFGLAVLVAFAPASRSLMPATAADARTDSSPMVAGLAALALVGPDTPEVHPVVTIERTWDTDRDDRPAIISWWDDERWTALENEQAAWRADWLREARRSPGNVPLELWPRIAEWAPYDRSIERSARAALGNETSIRRYATRLRDPRRSDPGRMGESSRVDDSEVRVNRDNGERLRRWARDALRDLRDRASDRTRRSRRPRNDSR